METNLHVRTTPLANFQPRLKSSTRPGGASVTAARAFRFSARETRLNVPSEKVTSTTVSRDINDLGVIGRQDGADLASFDDSKWQSVRLPHDWAISGPYEPQGNAGTGKLPWRGEGWYRKTFLLPESDAGKRAYLDFDGVMAMRTVYVNGKRAGGWDYGYMSFRVDASEFVKPGQNVGEQQEQRKSGKPLDFTRLANFWRLVAPRYANNAHVLYELSNEPTFDGGMFLKPEFHGGLMGVYRQVRQDAPQRTVLLFSFNSTDPDLKAIVDTYASELDWAHTMVAFHFYGGDGTSKEARRLAQVYPAICTEWDYPGTADYVKQVDGKLLIAETCEDMSVGWIDWRAWDDTKLDRITNILIPDAKAKKYWWGKN